MTDQHEVLDANFKMRELAKELDALYGSFKKGDRVDAKRARDAYNELRDVVDIQVHSSLKIRVAVGTQLWLNVREAGRMVTEIEKGEANASGSHS